MANEPDQAPTLDDIILGMQTGAPQNLTIEEITMAARNKNAEDTQRQLEEAPRPERKDPKEYLKSLLRKEES